MKFPVGAKPILAILCLWIAQAAHAADSPLTLGAAVEQALGRDAELSRLESRVEAESERAVSAGALPDPRVRVGAMNLPEDSFRTDETGMTQLVVGVSQSFPAGDTRELSRRRGSTRAEAVRAMMETRRLEVTRTVRRVWLEARHVERAIELIGDTRRLFEQLVDITEDRYASGRSRQGEVLRARLERDRLAERELQLESRRAELEGELERWLGETTAPAAGEAPDLPAVSTLADIRERLAAHPLIAERDRQLAASQIDVELADEQFEPSWMVDLSYGVRNGVEMTGAERENLVSGMISFSVPLYAGSRQKRELAAARADARGARDARKDRLRALQGRLTSAWGRQQRLERLHELFRDRLTPTAEQTVRSELTAYRSESGDFTDLVRAQVAELETRLRRLRIETDRLLVRTELLYLMGGAR